MNVDEALRQPGQLVAAWDDTTDDVAWLGIYSAGDSGVKLLADERIGTVARDKRLAELAKRPVLLGATSGGELVWSIAGDQFMAWNLRQRLFVAGRREVVAGDVCVADIVRVTSFVAPENLGHRGVRLERASGGQLVLAEEHDPTPEMDPTYDRSNVSIDAAWASALGRALSSWLGVAHDDQI